MFCFWVTLSSGYLALYILMPSMLNHSSHVGILRSEEHTSELQSQSNIVCRLLLEKKNQDEHQARSALKRIHHHFRLMHIERLCESSYHGQPQLTSVVTCRRASFSAILLLTE